MSRGSNTNIEAFVKVDSKGWKTLARTVRPLIERILEDQVREAGYFVSLMTRLVLTYPNWACQVVANQTAIETEARQRFIELVNESRQPGALRGRPVVVQNPVIAGSGPAPALKWASRTRLVTVAPRAAHASSHGLPARRAWPSERRDECPDGSSPSAPGAR